MQKRALLTVSALSTVVLLSMASQASAQGAPAEASVSVGEVVVTAERRTQSIQKSSLAIEVVSAEAVKDAGVTQMRDLTKLQPGVSVGQGGPATQIYIRGVGDFGSTPTTNPAVATHVDGVYVARANSLEGNFFDLERIEVLKGPQGTLYGRNATGGAVNIITAKPKLNDFGGRVDAEVGDYSLAHITAALNLPVGQTMALRAAVDVVSRGGYSKQDFDDDHHQSYRLQALWKPNDDFSLRLSGDYAHIGGMGPGYLIKGPLDPGQAAKIGALGAKFPVGERISVTDPLASGLVYGLAAINGLCIPAGALATVRTVNGPAVPNPSPQGLCPAGQVSLITQPDLKNHKMNNKFTNFSAELNYNLGFATLTVLPAYRRARNDYITYPTVGYDDAGLHPERSDMWTNEIRLGNSGARLTWVAGLYYFREIQDVATGLSGNNLALWGPRFQQSKMDTISQAAFGQATYSLTDSFRVLGGLRYAHDHRTIQGQTFYMAEPWAGLPYVIGQPCYNGPLVCVADDYVGDRKWNQVTYKVGVEYDLTPQNMLFVTYGTGTKAGGFNQSSALVGATPGQNASFYDPEKLAALEVGSRNRFLNNRLQANLELFYWKYRDAQETFQYNDAAGGIQFGYTNAGRAKMYGGDLDVTWRLTPVDTFQVGLEYIKSNFDSFVYSSGGLTSATSGCAIANQPDGTQQIDCSGRPLIRTPKWSGTVRYDHTFELSTGATINVAWSGQFATARYGNVDFIPATRMKSYVSHDLLATYRAPDRNWEAAIFARNVTNALIYTGTYAVPGLFPGLVVANLGAPRTFAAWD